MMTLWAHAVAIAVALLVVAILVAVRRCRRQRQDPTRLDILRAVLDAAHHRQRG
jgi:hypothetical protein